MTGAAACNTCHADTWAAFQISLRIKKKEKKKGTNYGIYLQFLSMRQGQIGGAERSLDLMF